MERCEDVPQIYVLYARMLGDETMFPHYFEISPLLPWKSADIFVGLALLEARTIFGLSRSRKSASVILSDCSNGVICCLNLIRLTAEGLRRR